MTVQNLGDVRKGQEERDRFIGLPNENKMGKASHAVTSSLGVWVLSDSGVVQRKQGKGPAATPWAPRSRLRLEQVQFAFLLLCFKLHLS